jgi:hypothetical protein
MGEDDRFARFFFEATGLQVAESQYAETLLTGLRLDAVQLFNLEVLLGELVEGFDGFPAGFDYDFLSLADVAYYFARRRRDNTCLDEEQRKNPVDPKDIALVIDCKDCA